MLALPALFVGVWALSQGGIAEPFSASQMAKFCTLAFWPVTGCAIGQVLTIRQRKKATANRQSKA